MSEDFATFHPISKLLVASILATILSIGTFRETALAQTTSNIGTSTFAAENFACRTYPGGEDIVIKRKGKTRTVSKKQGAKVANGHVKNLKEIIKVLKKEVGERRKIIKKLQKSISFLKPEVQQQINKLEKQIDKLSLKISVRGAQLSELQAIGKAIEACGKVPTVQVGGNGTASKLFTLPVSGERYYIFAYHAFTFAGAIPAEVCTRINGKIDLVRHTNRFCCVGKDGPGGVNFAECIEPDLGPNTSAFGLGGACDGFSSGRYDLDVEEVEKALAKVVEVFLPNAQGRCL